jgi:signal transduction histidine kinase/DNA-binding response OmpR family regulator
VLAPYSSSLRFEFAAPRFDDAERNEFQSYLEGFDSGWSAWSREASRAYTNLPEGRYRFHARGRDVRGEVGEEAVFAFTIPPPWYRTTWAYAFYALLLCGCLVAGRKLQVKGTRSRLERQREHLELEKLRELDRLKSRFFADVSHEFRTPISLILGPVSQMLEESPSPEHTQRLRLVRRHAQYLLRLISQFLDLSRLESRKMPLRVAPGEFMDDVAGIISAFTEISASRGVRLHFERPPTTSTKGLEPCYFDRHVLEKILNNLLGNAFKFTPDGGTVSVEGRWITQRSGVARVDYPEAECVEIVVSDSGPGIAPEHLPHVFDRFYQVEGTRSREGFGIGLALVKELVELHRGTVVVESEHGKGTRVVVRLAVARDQFRPDEIIDDTGDAPETIQELQPGPVPLRSDAPALTVSPALPDVDARTTVLIVEDHADLRRFLRDQLQSHYRIVEARDGAEGLERAGAILPGLVLSDVMMREIDGFELCRALKTNERTAHIPVVLLTARAGREDRLLGLNTGADCYLVKPFDPPELLARVRNLVDQRRLLRERFSASVVLKPSEVAATPADQAFLSRLLAVVESNLEDPEFDVARLGRAIGLSRSQLHRKVRALTKQPPTLLIRSIRLERAAELLARRTGSVAEIAYSVGFSSQAYFAKCFREQFHSSPKEYRDARCDRQPAGASLPGGVIHMRHG